MDIHAEVDDLLRGMSLQIEERVRAFLAFTLHDRSWHGSAVAQFTLPSGDVAYAASLIRSRSIEMQIVVPDAVFGFLVAIPTPME